MRIRINPSQHAARGSIVATARGQIIWRGSAKELANARGADTWHCHSDDAPIIRAALEKRGAEVVVMN